MTDLPTAVRGECFYLYLLQDLYSRKLVGWKVYTNENGSHSSTLLKHNCLAESIAQKNKPQALHPDYVAPMRSSTLLANMQF